MARDPELRHITKVETRVSGQHRYQVRVPGCASETFTNLGRAMLRRDELIAERDAGNDPNLAKRPFSELAAMYATSRPGRTHQTTRRDIDLYLLPRWGATPVGDIRTAHIAKWLIELSTNPGVRGKPLEPATLHHIYSTMKGIMSKAALLGYVPVSPCPDAKRLDGILPKRVKQAKFPIEQATVLRIVAELDERYHAPILLAASTGLRHAELRALRWSDIRDGRVHVTRQMVSGGGRREPVYDDPKYGSVGSVSLAPYMVEVLRQHRLRFPSWGTDLLFTTTEGNPLDQNRLLDQWQTARRRAGVTEGYAKIHDLRAHFITLMTKRVDLVAASTAARHQELQTTVLYQRDQQKHDQLAGAVMQQVHDEAI